MANELNWEDAVEFIALYNRWVLARSKYFRRKRWADEYGEDYSKAYYYEWSDQNKEQYEKINEKPWGERTDEEEKFCKDWHFFRGLHETVWYALRPDLMAHPNLSSYRVCPYQPDSEKKEALEEHLNSLKKMRDSNFIKWLSGQKGYQRAIERLNSKTGLRYPVAKEWREKLYKHYDQTMGEPDRIVCETILQNAICKSLLVVTYPEAFGREIAETLEFEKKNSSEMPQAVQRSAARILRYLEKTGDDAVILKRYLERMQEGLPARTHRRTRKVSLPWTKNQRLFVREVTLHTRGQMIPGKSKKNMRFYPDVIADLCLLISRRRPTDRAINTIMGKYEKFDLDSREGRPILGRTISNREHERLKAVFENLFMNVKQ